MTLAVLTDLLRAADPPAALSTEPRRRGRPTVRTPTHYAQLLAAHAQALTWFTESHGRAPRGDRELLTAWCAHALRERGRRGQRTTVPDFDRRLKTVCNALGVARRLASDPNKSHLLG